MDLFECDVCGGKVSWTLMHLPTDQKWKDHSIHLASSVSASLCLADSTKEVYVEAMGVLLPGYLGDPGVVERLYRDKYGALGAELLDLAKGYAEEVSPLQRGRFWGAARVRAILSTEIRYDEERRFLAIVVELLGWSDIVVTELRQRSGW